MWIISGQSLADGLDEDGVVGGDAEAARLQQVALDLEVEGGGESAKEVVGGGAQVGVAAAQVEQCHVEEGAGHILGSDPNQKHQIITVLPVVCKNSLILYHSKIYQQAN